MNVKNLNDDEAMKSHLAQFFADKDQNVSLIEVHSLYFRKCV